MRRLRFLYSQYSMIILDNRQSNDWLVVNIWLVVESIYLIFMKMDSLDWVYAQTRHNHIDQPTSQWLNILTNGYLLVASLVFHPVR